MDFAKRIIENPGKLFIDRNLRNKTHIFCSFLLVIFRLKREEQSLSNIRKYSYIFFNNNFSF